MSSRTPPSCPSPEAGIHEHWTKVDGHRMRFQHGGRGRPLLLIHGLLGYSFSWRFNLTALAHRATVFAPDLLGAGFSERVPGLDCSMAAIAGRLLKFLEGQGIEKFDLLGTSHGGAVAMVLASMAHERNAHSVRRLILVDAAHPWSHPRPILMTVLSHAAGAAAFRAVAPHIQFTHKHYLRRMYGDARRIPPGTAEGYLAPLTVPGAYDYALSIVRCWRQDMRQLESSLPKIADMPALLLWGDRDRVIPLSSTPPLERQFNHARLIVLRGAGHLPYEEMPEEFNRTVLDFLESE